MRRPNLLVLMPDQLRADFLGCYGNPVFETPNIDALSLEGVRYQRAISPSPLCVPARASLLTGKNAVENGVLDNLHWLHPEHNAIEVPSWPSQLNAAGYQTAAIGKMHFYPWDASEGFDTRIIAEDKRHLLIEDDYHDYLEDVGLRRYHGNEHEGYVEHKGAIISRIPAEHQVDTWVATQSCQFIEQHQNKHPFALMVGFPGPHCPYDPPATLADHYDPETMPASVPATPDSARFRAWNIAANKRPWNGVDYTSFEAHHKARIRAYYAALVKQIDQGIGRIIASLKDRGLYEDTVIIFTSDHGDFLGDYDLIGKTLFYEPSIHVPLIVKPATSAKVAVPRTLETSVSLTDVTATLLALAGLEPQATADSCPLPGLGLETPSIRDAIFGATNLGMMLTDDTWKYCRYTNGDTHLFDLTADPTEQYNLAEDASFRPILRELDAALFARLMTSLEASCADKAVFTAYGSGREASGKRGWKRHYPARG
ncbi:MAG: sulfatase-like hydrolase/transferase [Deinococcota bacterium]